MGAKVGGGAERRKREEEEEDRRDGRCKEKKKGVQGSEKEEG